MKNAKFIATIAASTLMSAAAALPAFAEETLRLSYFGGPKGTSFAEVIQPWADAINAEGEGILQIETYPGGALVGSPPGQVKGLTDGVADIAWVVFSYTPGRFPDNGVLELPTLYENVEESQATIRALYDEGLLSGYEDFYVPLIATTYPYNFHTTDPVSSIADMKGKKIRAGGPVAGAALEALGAVPVGMPIPSVAENISKGVLDGAAADWSVLYGFRIDQVAKNHYMQHFSTVPLGLMMTQERYDSLEPAAQALLDKYSGEWVENLYVEANIKAQESLIAKNMETDGHTIVYPSDEDKAAYDELMQGVVDGWVAGGEGRAEILDFVNSKLSEMRSGN